MAVCYQQATLRDVPAMIDLWKLCFPEDDESFICRFFAKFPVECGCISRDSNDIIGMLFLLPAQVDYQGDTYPVRYLYAGCTHPAYRNQGIYKQLLSFASERATFMGAGAIYLHPASDSLAGYYERFGYRYGIGDWLSQGGNDAAPVLSPEEYLMSRSLLSPKDKPVWRLEGEGNLFFLQEMLADGWHAVGDAFSCGLLSADCRFGYDCHGVAYGDTAAGVCGATFRNTAMWLPIGDSPLISLMDTRCGYTAFLGDI